MGKELVFTVAPPLKVRLQSPSIYQYLDYTGYDHKAIFADMKEAADKLDRIASILSVADKRSMAKQHLNELSAILA